MKNKKFEATFEFAKNWLNYKNLAGPTQEVMITPIVKQKLKIAGISLCDLGCGDGELTHKLSELNPKEVIGIDINRTLIKLAIKRQIPNSTFHLCNAAYEKLPIMDSAIDLFFSSNMFMHLNNDEVQFSLKECYRVLKNGGQISFLVTHLNWAKSNYILKQVNDDTFYTKRLVWSLSAVEHYRSTQFYSNLLTDTGFQFFQETDVIIPNDNRLNIRYLSQAGLPLFSLLCAFKP